MRIVNTGSKIIGIGKFVLMPDESYPISKEIAESAPVKAYVRMGFVRIEKDVKVPDAVAEDATVEEPKTSTKKASAKAKAE